MSLRDASRFRTVWSGDLLRRIRARDSTGTLCAILQPTVTFTSVAMPRKKVSIQFFCDSLCKKKPNRRDLP
jgi:hypothetical protein